MRQLHMQQEQLPLNSLQRSAKLSRSLVLVLALVAAGDANIRDVLTKEASAQATALMKKAEDARLLAQIDIDLEVALKQCLSFRNLVGIPLVLSRLSFTESVTINDLCAASKGCVSQELFRTVNESLRILERNPHLYQRAAEKAAIKLKRLSWNDPRKLPLQEVLSHCMKQMPKPNVEGIRVAKK